MWGGINYSWGVLQLSLVKGELSSAATLSFVGGLSSACISAFATLNSNLVRRFGVRRCALAGSVLVAFAQIFSGWTTKNLGGMFVCSGFMMGTGMSILFMVSRVCPNQEMADFLSAAMRLGRVNAPFPILQAPERSRERHRIFGFRARRSRHEHYH
jgi:hypothetical protein